MSDLIQRLRKPVYIGGWDPDEPDPLRLEAAAEIERLERERIKEKDLYGRVIDDVFDGMECDPECDSYGHTETCCATNGTEAVKKLRRQRDEAIAALRELVRLQNRPVATSESEGLEWMQQWNAAWESARRLLNQKP